ncbi:[Ribosomal protein S18]-alanine N-acetyltransferase [Microbulbifer aestuariivivens]|uniref:[Ribosomal protein S18]-alanine N-acetyltransferase n=1 Tax=Microbulbifer aestuariivivens TaxID=1908308 RepID=A0ABP9WNX8_9GAMM
MSADSLSLPQAPGAGLRPAAESDCAALAALARSAHSHPWSERQYLDSVREGHQCWLLAAADGSALASCVLMPLPQAFEVLDVAVAPQCRRRGIARAVLQTLIARLPTDTESVLLEVRTGNTGARALYRSLGFREDGVRRNYYPAANGAREDAVLMTLSLG